ncbi:hypothetical protein H4R18_001596 [Coemansia javaensis]|uniref:HMG box domain-containing protein n=1 Tax=Coemansia javaensis TaxID=2761396 RepID=A0A9W8LIY0_9FUNG|nr:hypothetical protein H4R18_001596 [Coemansia javaensis]
MDQGRLFMSANSHVALHHPQSVQQPMPPMSHSASDPSSTHSPAASDSPSSAVTPGASTTDLGLTLGSHHQQLGHSGPASSHHHHHHQQQHHHPASHGRQPNGYVDASSSSQQQQYTQLPPTSSLPQPAYSSAFSSIAPPAATSQPHPAGALYQAPPQGSHPASSAAQYRQHDQTPGLAPLQLSQLGVIGGQRPPTGFPYDFDPNDGSCRGLYPSDMDPAASSQNRLTTTNHIRPPPNAIPVNMAHQPAFSAPHAQHPLDMAAAAAANISLPVDMGGDQSAQPALHTPNAQSSFGGSQTGGQPFIPALGFQNAQIHDYDPYNRPAKRTGRAAKPKRTPRPPNAFILYRKAKQAEVIRDNPGVSNKDVSCIIGQMWKSEDPAVQDKYRELAEIEKKKHKEMHPNYKYQPRKPKNKRLQESQAAAGAVSGGALLPGGAQDGGGQFGGGLPSVVKDSSASSASAGFQPYPKYHLMMHSGHGQPPQTPVQQQQPHPAHSQAQASQAHSQPPHIPCGDEYYYRGPASLSEQAHQPHAQQQQPPQPHAGGFVGVPQQLDIKQGFMGGMQAAYWTPATPSDAAFSNTLPSGNVFNGGEQAAMQMRPFESVVHPGSVAAAAAAAAGHAIGASSAPMFHPFDHQRQQHQQHAHQQQQQQQQQAQAHETQGHADYQTGQAYHQHHAAASAPQPHSAPALGGYVGSSQPYHHPQQGMEALDGSAVAGSDPQALGLLSPPAVAWSANM